MRSLLIAGILAAGFGVLSVAPTVASPLLAPLLVTALRNC